MKLLPIIHANVMILLLASILAGQSRFECSGKIYISASDSNTTTIYFPAPIPFAPPKLQAYAIYNGNFDAMGFNPKDNYIYSVEQNTNNIVRHSYNSNFERIGQASMVDTLKSNAGDCTADGMYMCYDYRLGEMLVFDVVDEFKLLRTFKLFWDPTSANKDDFTIKLFDFAFDPNDTKTAYSYQGNYIAENSPQYVTNGSMLKINVDLNDPNLGMVTPLGKINTNEITHIAALAFDSNSSLYGYGSSLQGLNPPQSILFNVGAYQGQIAPILFHSPAHILSDACSCPFSLTFTNATPQDGMFCSNDTKFFTLEFNNNSYIPLTDVVLKDTLPQGTIIKSISNTFQGKVEVGTGIGTNILSISELLIPAKVNLIIKIELTSVNAKDGTVYNQAYLYNLPPRFPSVVKSDDPFSSPDGDRSNFFFITRGINNLSWKAISPTDCIVPNDGKLVISSADFIPGQGYEVSLRNKIGWKEYTTNIIIDDKNSFTIDSLYPGDYELFRFRSLNENCSLTLKDTTLLLEAPNNLIDLVVNSNSPICEGASLKLNSLMNPQGQISWRGPDIFGSEEFNPYIVNATSKKSGQYEATAKYGYCTQKRTIDVDVKPQVKTFIEGDSSVCLRDLLRLTIIEKESNQTLEHIWKGPSDFIKIDSVLLLPILGYDQSGYYEGISTNGACYDTVGKYVEVFPTPTLDLEKVVMTDYCDPLILRPKLKGDTDVTFQWFPQDGLSCVDCPNPQVNPNVKSSYILTVVNEYGCSDSASIQIVLDKRNLVFSPNIFSPSGSEIENKEFKIFPNCVVHYIHHLDIYDRAGNRIFYTSAISPDDELVSWDGLSSGKNVSSGVYVWSAKIELVDGSIVYLTGDVTIL